MCLTALEAGSPRSGCQKCWSILRALRETLSPATLLGLSMAVPSLCLHIFFSLSVSLCPNLPFCKDVSHIGLGATLLQV